MGNFIIKVAELFPKNLEPLYICFIYFYIKTCNCKGVMVRNSRQFCSTLIKHKNNFIFYNKRKSVHFKLWYLPLKLLLFSYYLFLFYTSFLPLKYAAKQKYVCNMLSTLFSWHVGLVQIGPSYIYCLFFFFQIYSSLRLYINVCVFKFI